MMMSDWMLVTYFHITLKVVKNFNPIGAIKIITKPNCNLCMEECLIILKNLCQNFVTLINDNSDIYGAYLKLMV